jgi:outer membrane protein assembly factor BamB
MPHGLRSHIAIVTMSAMVGLTAAAIAVHAQTSPKRAPRATAPQPPTTAAPPKLATPPEPWRTWGGPRGNFTSAATGLADKWPEDGPPRLWTRTIGDGYSGISAENGVLYTAYRRGAEDVVVAMEEASGKTLWETKYAAPFSNAGGPNIAPGPYAMPQIIGDRIVMASGTGLILSLDKRTGRIVWQHDVYGEYGGTRLGFGYSCHALPYKDTLIVLVGGRAGLLSRLMGGTGTAAVAFKQSDGAVVWQNLSFDNAHSSPLLITVDGQPQVVALLAQEVIGFSPDNGAELWRHPHETPYGLAISQPVWGPDNVLFVSSAYGSGSRALELHQRGGATTVKELWANPRLQLHFGSAIRVGDYVYLSDAYNGPAIMTAVEVKTGKAAWQRRLFAKAQLLAADGKLIVLDEDGTLALAAATPQSLEVLSMASLLKKTAWTPPTLVGTRLYVRDRSTLMALDLAPQPARPAGRS